MRRFVHPRKDIFSCVKSSLTQRMQMLLLFIKIIYLSRYVLYSVFFSLMSYLTSFNKNLLLSDHRSFCSPVFRECIPHTASYDSIIVRSDRLICLIIFLMLYPI